MHRFTLRQLEYLIACVDHGSIAAAAEGVSVSQPTISVAITKLEQQFGSQLLIRQHAQGVIPTTTAKNILPNARILLNQANELQHDAMTANEIVSGTIRLGSFITLAPVILPNLIKKLMKDYPQIHLDITEGTQEKLIKELKNGKIDVALLYDIDLSNDINCTQLSDSSPYVALPNNHSLAKKDEILLSDLVNLPLILLDVAPSRSFFLGLFEEEGLVPTIAHTSPSLELIRGMVGCGLGYSLLVTRPYGDKTYDGSEIIIKPLKGSHSKSRIVLGNLKNLKKTNLIKCFEKTATELF